ncbi:MAG: hypothetical protein R6V46_17955 [Desulfatiglandaceae bacterium]
MKTVRKFMCYWVIELSRELPTKIGVEEAILGKMLDKESITKAADAVFLKVFSDVPQDHSDQ